jgi:transcriptional regulator with XRE-family HTH domain
MSPRRVSTRVVTSVVPVFAWVDIYINPAYILIMRFGKILRQLRLETGLGIKSLAPELHVNYTYLSKLENETITPSEELVDRVAEYFGFDRDSLLLSAGKVPEDILQILRDHPDDAIAFLRKQFGEKDGKSEFQP